MFLAYMLAELRRRSGRTVLTALGLALGVGLVVMVNALSTGFDRAQAEVLRARRRHSGGRVRLRIFLGGSQRSLRRGCCDGTHDDT